GPGTVEILAGRNLDLGIGASNPDGTATGITTIGNRRNPHLPFDGASITIGAGIGRSFDLDNSNLDFEGFITDIIGGDAGARYLDELSAMRDGNSAATEKFTPEDFAALPESEKNRMALDLFYLVLRDAGRDHNIDGSNYEAGFDAINALFANRKWHGDIDARGRDIRTKNGGDIAIFAPGGELKLSNVVIGNPLVPPGIITETGGDISIFTDADVSLGIGRIFTLRGGNEIIWSSTGDIAAGSAAKTIASAPPTRVLLDPQSADVETDLAGLSTGGGIGVLATVEGVPPGDVDLVAPAGIVDAGDASIRASGNVTIAAVTVLNADNIAAASVSGAPPAPAPPPAPNIAGLTSASNVAGATNSAAESIANQARQQAAPEETPSVITVEVVGYGGGDGEDGG
ncbi:MAG: filamentous hemagglutinin family protein, partial [Chthoniobacterales bacterium]